MDIVERLRIRIHTSEDETALTNEAADEIERLRVVIKARDYHIERVQSAQIVIIQENERLREERDKLKEALRSSRAAYVELDDKEAAEKMIEIITAALKEKDNEN